MSAAFVRGQRAWRYAQRKGGQKLHIVEMYGNGVVESRGLCGVTPERMKPWRMTINLPLGNACQNCLRVSGVARGERTE